MGRTVSLEVHIGYVDVDVDLGDVSAEDLIAELRDRNAGVPEDSFENVTEMFYAFKLGQNDRAMELAKKIACDCTGRIL